MGEASAPKKALEGEVTEGPARKAKAGGPPALAQADPAEAPPTLPDVNTPPSQPSTAPEDRATQEAVAAHVLQLLATQLPAAP